MSLSDNPLDPSLVVTATREIELFEDNLLTVRSSDGSIFLPIRDLCQYLGLDRAAQVRRIKRDETLATDLVEFSLDTSRGQRETQYLRLESVPFWLSGISLSKVRPELRDKLLSYKRWVVRKVYEAFMVELARENQIIPASDYLEDLRNLGQALVQLTDEQTVLEQRQQFLLEQQTQLEKQQLATGEDVAVLKERVEKASLVVSKMLSRIGRLEKITAAGNLNEEQAAEISLAVKKIAGEMARQKPSGGNPYQNVFATLHERYGITSFRQLSAERYQEALGWLNEWYRSLLPTPLTEEVNKQES